MKKLLVLSALLLTACSGQSGTLLERGKPSKTYYNSMYEFDYRTPCYYVFTDAKYNYELGKIDYSNKFTLDVSEVYYAKIGADYTNILYVYAKNYVFVINDVWKGF